MAEHAFKIRSPGRRPNTAVKRLTYSTLIIIIDTLDAVAAALRWPRSFDKKLEDGPVESDQWDDEEILRRSNEDSEDRGHNLASTIEFVRTRTTIPIPRVRRRLKDKDGGVFVVMDYIDISVNFARSILQFLVLLQIPLKNAMVTCS